MTDTLALTLPELARVAEVARALNVDRRTVERYVASGRLESVKLGAGRTAPVRIPRRSVLELVEAGRR